MSHIRVHKYRNHQGVGRSKCALIQEGGGGRKVIWCKDVNGRE